MHSSATVGDVNPFYWHPSKHYLGVRHIRHTSNEFLIGAATCFSLYLFFVHVYSRDPQVS